MSCAVSSAAHCAAASAALSAFCRCLTAALWLLAATAHGASDAPLVAVATNFLPTAQDLATRHEAAGGSPVRLTGGATGKLYAQLHNGAPYELFLAADRARPVRLEADGRIVEDSRCSYALGTLVLWQPQSGAAAAGPIRTLRGQRFRRLAIAQPELAPYGLAAQQLLTRLDLWQTLAPRLARGENVGQTFAMAASGNADLALIAAAQLRGRSDGRRWTVPERWHAPIDQQMVLLRGASKAARDFHGFLRSGAARTVIAQHGYRLPTEVAHGSC
jgi:molybdate transport system substrate-binding protein